MLDATVSRVFDRCDRLAQCTETPGCITRLFGSPAMAEAHAELLRWMTDAGMACRVDPACNLIGCYRSATGTGRSLVVGSHLDTVVNAGRYDGILGVLLAVAAVETLRDEQAQLPLDVQVVAFSEEEGVRFGVPFIGSRALAGSFDPALLDRQDAEAVSLEQAIRQFGQNPRQIADAALSPDCVIAYLETHIEQGPILEARGLPIGVVESIVGQTRAMLHFNGQAGHAGTVPMDMRRDALVAAAKWVVAVEDVARRTPGLVATVGQLEVAPNVSNVIPGSVRLSLDVRHADDTVRTSAVQELASMARHLAAQRRLEYHLQSTSEHAATPLDGELTNLLADCIQQAGHQPHRLVSGAGHDAVPMAACSPTGMLFIRCGGGVSHHPDESVRKADVAIALDVLLRAIRRLAQS